jgi:L-ascorbate metabolism protein UlaG (beta-lactamase superfamily)
MVDRRTVGRILSAAAVLTLGGVGYTAARRSRNTYYDGPPSDHFDWRPLFPSGSTDRSGRRGPGALAARRRPRALAGELSQPLCRHPPERVDGLRITLVGHASILIQVAGKNLLADPVWAERVSPVRFAGPKRANPPGIRFEDLPPIDAVLVTHNHYDHLDVETISKLWAKFHPRVVAPLGNDAIIRDYDGDVEVATLDWGGSLDLGNGVVAHLEPANHWSARGLNDRRMALWGAWVLTSPAGAIYLAGDTGYGDGDHFRSVRGKYGAVKAALLPIGAYEPRWFMQVQHMNPADAVRAFADLEAAQALGIHWGTFQLTNEAVDQPATDLALALAASGIAPERFRALRPGEVWEG